MKLKSMVQHGMVLLKTPKSRAISSNALLFLLARPLGDVKNSMGLPDDIQGEKEIIFVYNITETSRIELMFNPALTGIKHIMDGAIRKIL